MTRPNRRDHDVLENDMMVDFMEAVAAAERKARETRDADERAILMARAEALRVAAKALEDRESDDPGLATIRRKLDEIEIQAADDIGFHTKDKHPRMDVIKGNPAFPFQLYREEGGTIGVRSGPVLWWWFYRSTSYGGSGDGTGWHPLQWVELTGGEKPETGVALFYVKVVRTAAYGTDDTFATTIESVIGDDLGGAEAAMYDASAWNVFVQPLGYVTAEGEMSQIHVGPVRFRDVEAPRTIKQWLGNVADIPDGYEVVSEAGGYFPLVTSGNAGATDEGTAMHSHGASQEPHDHDIPDIAISINDPGHEHDGGGSFEIEPATGWVVPAEYPDGIEVLLWNTILNFTSGKTGMAETGIRVDSIIGAKTEEADEEIEISEYEALPPSIKVLWIRKL